jgi:uncharacterized repeat protein (TIGR01451 family)
MQELKHRIALSLAIVLVISLGVLGLYLTQGGANYLNTAQAQTAYGPRGTVGPDVALTAAEQTAFANRVTASGFTSAAVQSALDSASTTGKRIVYFPAGTYTIGTTIQVPANITLIGDGSRTVLIPATVSTTMFSIKDAASNIRFTRMKFLGPFTGTWVQGGGSTSNAARGILVAGYNSLTPLENIRIDHLDMSGFESGIMTSRRSTVQIDHNEFHHNHVIGLGYGVVVNTGSYALIMDNIMHDSRANIIANYNNNQPTGYPYTRATHIEVIHNKFFSTSPAVNLQVCGICTKAGFQEGTFIIEGNHIEAPGIPGFDVSSGSGLVRNNEFGTSFKAFLVWVTSEEGINGKPYNIKNELNTFANSTYNYSIEAGVKNFMIDGQYASQNASTVNGVTTTISGPSTQDNSLLPPPLPIITPMADNGTLATSPLAWTNNTTWWTTSPTLPAPPATGTATPTPAPTPTPVASSTPIPPAVAAVTLVKAVDKTTAVSGDILTYTLTVKNTSTTVKANPVKITDTLPLGTTFVSLSNPESGGVFTNGQVSWSFVGGLNPGQITTVTFQVRVN